MLDYTSLFGNILYQERRAYFMANSYKDTMNLPKTDFPMRANLAQNEPKRLQKWEEEDIYHKVLEKNKDGEPFILHDGPPYANGPIHIGHAFNKILKDFVVKSHSQRGFYTPYIPGWDCHGQPIENMVERTLGTEKMAATDQVELRRLCREWAEKYVDIQRNGFKRLGVSADWEHPYLTFTPNYEAGNVEIFRDMYLKGSVYRGRKPIHWCTRCHTALAEAEIEYGDEVSPSIFVRFKMDELPEVFQSAGAQGDAYILIWTTTPWTLPANTAVSLSPDADYVMVDVDGINMILAHDLVESVAQTAQWENFSIVSDVSGNPVTLTGKELHGFTYTCPIRQDLKGVIIYGNHVALDTGTGCVHTAPGHGQDDYLVGCEFDIPMLMPVDDNGVFTDEAGQFAGLEVNDANPLIIDWLREQNFLVAEEEISHSYPHCWRCHKPVIFRATDQWFVSMDKNSLRKDALRAIENDVKWVPEWAENRIGSMIADRPDWCISRQRSWGVPIPVFKCAGCGSTVANEDTFDAVIDLFYKEGADAWFIRDPHEYLPHDIACESCGCTDILPEKDILDVWWESGVSHTSVLIHRSNEGLRFPADLYLEGSDQHRGWFQSSLLTSIGAYGVPPYKSVMHCGFIVDGDGRKMSKSLGNGIDPSEVVEKVGADVLRLWVASVDYSQDVSISDEILQRTAEAYRRIRNTFRFLLGSLFDFNNETDSVGDFNALEPLDQWMYMRLSYLLCDIEEAYEAYKFHNVFRLTYDFIVNDLSAVYMDATKDRLYSELPNSPRRRAVQTVLMNVLDVLVRTLAPILTFTCDEVWEHYPQPLRDRADHGENILLAGWPTLSHLEPTIPSEDGKKAYEDFTVVLEIRDAVTKALEDARTDQVINKSQEARVVISAPTEILVAAQSFDATVFEEILIVSEVVFREGDELNVLIEHVDSDKCPRCWNYRKLGTDGDYADVCQRCAEVLRATEKADY